MGYADLLDQGTGTTTCTGSGEASGAHRRVHRDGHDGRRIEEPGIRCFESEHEGAHSGGWRARALGILCDHGLPLHEIPIGHVADQRSDGTDRDTSLAILERLPL